MCHEKSGNGCEEDENIRGPDAEAGPCPTLKQRQEVAEAEENSGVDGRDKGGEQERQRIGQQQDTQAVVRSGCLRLHSRDGINFMDYSGLFCQVGPLGGSTLPICSRAFRRGALETLIIPSRGLFISRMRKISLARDSAQTEHSKSP